MSTLVFPPRNLGEGERWARHVEKHLTALTQRVQQLEQRTANHGRTTSGLAESLSDQITQIQQQQEQIARAVAELSTSQHLLNLVAQIAVDPELDTDDPDYTLPDQVITG